MTGPGLLSHHRVAVGLQPQGDGGQGVRQQVDKQQVHRREGHRQARKSGVQHRQNTRHVTGQQETNGFFDVGVNIPPVLHRPDDGGEIVVRQYHACGVLGHLSAGNAHGHADIRLLQGRRVVDPVAGHGHQFAPRLPGPYDTDLVLRGHPGVDRDLGGKLPQLTVTHSVDDAPLYRLGAVCQDTDLSGDGGSGGPVVSGDHNRPDPGGDARGDRRFGLFPGRVHHGDQSQEIHAALILRADCLPLDAAAGKGQHPQSFIRKALVGLLHRRSLRPGDDAPVQQHIHRALGDHQPPAGHLVHRAHQFAVGVKGELRQPGPVGPDSLFVKAMVLPQPHQSSLRRVAYLAAVIHCGVAAQQGATQQGLLNGVGKIRVRRVNHGPGGIQLPHRHFVLGQCAGLVGADDRHAAQALHRLKLSDDGVLRRHFLRAEGQHDGDDGTECLRDSRHSQRHGKQEGVHRVFMAYQHANGKQNSTNN